MTPDGPGPGRADLRGRRRGGGCPAKARPSGRRSCAPTPWTRPCGGRVFVKAECLQRTGSFKFRGAYNRISRLTAEERRRGVVAFSSGNHAQGVAAAARLVGCPAVIVMPADAPAVKIEATRGYRRRGGDLRPLHPIPRGHRRRDRRTSAARSIVPPFDDLHVIAGQGTVGLEAAAQLEAAGARADLLVSPASGGGLIAGIALAFERAVARAPPSTPSEPAGFDDHARSLAAGERARQCARRAQPLRRPDGARSREMLTFADQPAAPGGRRCGRRDEEALAAMAFAFRHLKLVLEPGGATAWPPCLAVG